MKRIKKTFLFILVLFLCANEVSPTIIIPSIIMAMSGGLIMSKMTLGGLMMMLMAANQQQKGQNILRNLGQVPLQEGLSVPTGASSASSDTPAQNVGIEELIVRRKRHADNFNSNSTNSTSNERPKIDLKTQYRIMRQVAASDPLSCLPQALCGISATPPSTQSGFLNDYAYLLKQVFTRDEDIDDLDKEDDNEELEEFNKLKYNNKKKKKGSKGSSNKLVEKSDTTSKKSNASKKKKKGSNKEESSEEYEVPLNDEELENLMMKEAYEVENLANEELVDEEPDFFQYAVRDSVSGGSRLGPYAPPGRPDDVLPPDEEEEFVGIAPSELNKMSESELDVMLAKINRNSQNPGLYRGGPGPGGPHLDSGPPPSSQKEKAPASSSSNSVWEMFLPKVSLGFTPGQGQNFGNDPFFSGFKRSIDTDTQRGFSPNIKVRAATPEEEQMFREMIQRKRKRLQFINLKRKELSEIKDPVEKFRIAAEFGERTKSARQCRVLFNNCPFTYHQVLEMISGLRKALTGEPLTDPKKQDTVVELKPASTTTTQAPPPPPPPPPQPVQPVTKNIINVNSGRESIGGTTSILHQLPTGERVEINLKMTKSGLTQTPSQKQRPKIRYTTTTKPPLISMLSKNKNKPVKDIEDLFDDEDELKASALSTDKTIGTLTSLESLKATMLAIQKINNVTVQRKKEGKPISFSHVFADLKKPSSSSEPKKRPQKRPEPEDIILPEPDPEVLTKLQAQNLRPKAKKPIPIAQQTASSLLASSLVKIEDDEVEVDYPEIKPVKGTNIRVKRPPSFPPKNKFANITPSKTNQELTAILEDLRAKAKAKKDKEKEAKRKKASSQKQKEAEDQLEEDNEYDDATDEDDDDEEEDDDRDYHNPNIDVEEEEEDDRGRSGVKAPKRPKVNPEDMLPVPIPEEEEETPAGRIQATQTFVRRQLATASDESLPDIESTSSNKHPRRKHRKPKKLFPNESTEYIRLIPL